MGHYSLWLIPSGAQHSRLEETIERLSRDPGGPRFDPHLTLLGGLDGGEEHFAAATELLAASLLSITLQFRSIEFGDEHYRAVYLRVEQEDDLMAAHREALRLFGKREDPAFTPHVSLFYGTLSPATRTSIADSLGDWRGVACRAGHLRLVAIGGGPPSWRTVRECALSFRGC